jgi:hypothetical protein
MNTYLLCLLAAGPIMLTIWLLAVVAGAIKTHRRRPPTQPPPK